MSLQYAYFMDHERNNNIFRYIMQPKGEPTLPFLAVPSRVPWVQAWPPVARRCLTSEQGPVGAIDIQAQNFHCLP